MKIKLYLVTILLLSLTACDFSHQKRIGETDYYIRLGNEYISLGFGNKNGNEGIIESRITDVYWNENYILVKRCELYSDEVIGYYVVKIVRFGQEKATPNIFGPLSKEEYEEKKKELNLNEKYMEYIETQKWIYQVRFW